MLAILAFPFHTLPTVPKGVLMKKELYCMWKSSSDYSEQMTDGNLFIGSNCHTVIFENGSPDYAAKDAILELIRHHLPHTSNQRGELL